MKKNTIEIILGGVEYDLSFNFSVIKSIQLAIKGLKVEDIFNGIAEQNFNIISELLYRGIKFNHKDFNREIIDELGFDDIENIFTSIAKLFEVTMPTTSDDNKVGTKKK